MLKMRLDQFLLFKNLVDRLDRAITLIMDGAVLVDDQKITKPGTIVLTSAKIQLLKPPSHYVSRGGEKIEGAWEVFHFPVKDRIALDIGISTGGFTDFLLQKGSKRVIGVDVAYGIIDYRLRQNDRVVLLERTNAKTLTHPLIEEALQKASLPKTEAKHISLVVMDVSFISVSRLLPVIKPLVTSDADFIILVKPQFEAARSQVGPGGVIRDPKVIKSILNDVQGALEKEGFSLKEQCPSPIRGAKGNQEHFFWLTAS